MGETFFLTETLKRYIRFNPYDKNNFALWWPFCITFESNQIKSIYLRSREKSGWPISRAEGLCRVSNQLRDHENRDELINAWSS